ncbi:hypothetical protein BHE74_00024748 [Ensete ventricosum]|nr:hypothetical protein BHE74_00024748 [Ensete ventricosum]
MFSLLHMTIIDHHDQPPPPRPYTILVVPVNGVTGTAGALAVHDHVALPRSNCDLCARSLSDRCVRRDLLVLISKSDASILAFAAPMTPSAPPTANSFRYIDPRSNL